MAAAAGGVPPLGGPVLPAAGPVLPAPLPAAVVGGLGGVAAAAAAAAGGVGAMPPAVVIAPPAPAAAAAMAAAVPPPGAPGAGAAGVLVPLAGPPPAPLPLGAVGAAPAAGGAALAAAAAGVAARPVLTTVKAVSEYGHAVKMDEQRIQDNQEKLDRAFSAIKDLMKATAGATPGAAGPFVNLDTLLIDVALQQVIYEEKDPATGIVEIKELSFEELFEKNPALKPLMKDLTSTLDDIWGVVGGNVSYRTLGDELLAGKLASFDSESTVIKGMARRGYDDTATFMDSTPKWGEERVEKAMTTVYEAYKKEVLARTPPLTPADQDELLKSALKKMQAGIIALHTLEQELKTRQEALQEPVFDHAAPPAQAKLDYEKAMQEYTKEKEKITADLQNLYQVDWLILFSALAVGEPIDPAGKSVADLKKSGVDQADKVFTFVNGLIQERFDAAKKEHEGTVKEKAKKFFKDVTGRTVGAKSPYANRPAFYQYAVDAGSVACGLIPNEALRNSAYAQYTASHNKSVRVTGSIEEAVVRIVGSSARAGGVAGGFVPPGALPAGGAPAAAAAVVAGPGFALPGAPPAGGAPAAAAPPPPVTPLALPKSFRAMLEGVTIAGIDTTINDAVADVFAPPPAPPPPGPAPVPAAGVVPVAPAAAPFRMPQIVDPQNPTDMKVFMAETCRIFRAKT